VIITPSSSTFAPRFFTIANVFIVSSARKKLVILLVPFASIANIALRCEIDLSAAISAIEREKASAARTVTFFILNLSPMLI